MGAYTGGNVNTGINQVKKTGITGSNTLTANRAEESRIRQTCTLAGKVCLGIGAVDIIVHIIVGMDSHDQVRA